MLPLWHRPTRQATVPPTCSTACPTQVTGTRLDWRTIGLWHLGTAMIQASTSFGKFSHRTGQQTILSYQESPTTSTPVTLLGLAYRFLEAPTWLPCTQ